MAAKWALFFYIVPNSPDNATKLDSRAKRVRDELVALAKKHPKDLRIAYRLALSGTNPAQRVLLDPAGAVQEDEDTVYEPGDPEPFKRFFRWAHKKGCKGDRCAVFLWGHGFGPAGLFSLEDLVDLGVAQIAPPLMPLPQLIGPKIAPLPTTPAPAAVALEPVVMVDEKRGILRRAGGLRIKLRPTSLVRMNGQLAVHVQPDIPNKALAPPIRFSPVTFHVGATHVTTTTVNLASGLAGLRKLRKKPTDVVLFQCCWTSGLEYSRQLHGDARVMIGSQTLLPIQKTPWPYKRLFDSLLKSRKSDQRESKRLAQKLVKTLSTWHAGQKQPRPITGLNVNDNTVPKAFARLVKALKRQASGQPLDLEHLYSNASKQDRKHGLYKAGNTGLIDVLRLCEEFSGSNDPAVAREANRLARIVQKNLILAHQTPQKRLYRGVTVYYQPSQNTIDRLDGNGDAHIEFLQQPEYDFFAFARATKWGDFAFEL